MRDGDTWVIIGLLTVVVFVFAVLITQGAFCPPCDEPAQATGHGLAQAAAPLLPSSTLARQGMARLPRNRSNGGDHAT